MPGLVPLGASSARFLVRRIVDLIEQIQVLILAEDVADVGHVLLAVAHQRIDSLAWLLARLALRGQHDGAHLERSLLQIGQRDVGDERAHAAGLIFAHHKLELILARAAG